MDMKLVYGMIFVVGFFLIGFALWRFSETVGLCYCGVIAIFYGAMEYSGESKTESVALDDTDE